MDSKSLSWSYIYVIVAVFACAAPPMAAATNLSNGTDQEALLELKKEIMDDPFGVVKSWNESVHFCDWHGVKCGRRHQRVTVLDLSQQNLTGSISPYVGNLSFLKVLYLHQNSFLRQIPPELGRLKRLQDLRLHNNSLGGEIPSNISGCSNLVIFSVFYNELVGKIPEKFGSLSKLRYVYLANNNLTGVLPPSLGNLSSLAILSAPSNSIIGSIPTSLGRLSKLETFLMPSNKLSGTIPPTLFNISSLITFDVIQNKIQGSLPPDMGIHVLNLTFFGISMNQITGPLPASLSNLSNLEFLLAGENNLVGEVPHLEKLHKLQALVLSVNHLGNGAAGDLSFISSLTNASNLRVLGLNVNNFGGVLPETFSNLSTKLRLLHLEMNQISGSFPSGITHLSNLEDINMGSNQFTGPLPVEVGNLQNLRQFNISQNYFFGSIPSSLGNLSLLTRLILELNNFQGNIPSSLSSCKNLQWLSLSVNNLSGTIPPGIFTLPSLSMFLDLSGNQFMGSLPMEVGNLKSIFELDVSSNKLSGEIPSSLGSCLGLEYLYMQDNSFWGKIPSSLSSLRGIKILDLSQNNLSGEIPKFLGDFDLQYLNLSFNDFEGPIPKGRIFTNGSAVSVDGNSKLCGGMFELKLPACNFTRSRNITSTLTFKITLSVVGGLLGVILLLCLVFAYWSKRTKHNPHSNLHQSFSPLKLSYEILLQATDGFSSDNLIGMGSFGSVYKGILGDEGTIIAIKVFNLLNNYASKSFMAECEALRSIKHRNLVKVLTACSSTDHRGNDFKALVYEYMKNGSLEEWLHADPRGHLDHVESKKLNLLQRLSIVIDVSSALSYLHNHSHTTVVHCDLKPSNVLLDDELIGHVGDFGLARFLPRANQEFSKEQTVSIDFRGSIGYVAPEYGMGSQVSTQGDVYSFGIILLEMFTGRRPTDDMFKDDFDIHNYVKAALPDRVAEIVDPVLTEHEEEDAAIGGDFRKQTPVKNSKIQESLTLIFGVGVACSAELARERMDITDAADELQSIRDHLLRIN